jgi:hypothetical protein
MSDLTSLLTQLGSAGASTVILWLVYKDTSARLDRKEQAFRQLEEEVRREIAAQLIAATSTIRDNMTVMQHVIDKLKLK